MKRLILHSNAPWAPSGYGVQTALFAPKLAEHYELYISANYGLDAAPIIWNGIPVLPGSGGDHGNGTLPGHVAGTFGKPRDGLVLTLYDTVAFDPALFSKLNAACWAPVDHTPPPPRVMSFFRESQAIPIAMSRYGEEELAEFDPIYVPHGVDPAYKPVKDCREEMGLPADAFVVGMVAANKGHSPSRKSFQQAFEAFRFLRQKHDDAFLYLHTVFDPNWAQGEDIPTLLDSLEIPQERVRYPNQYQMTSAPISSQTMARIYSSMDVLLNPSAGAGFEVPVAEAQACGVPAIVTDFTAMSEVCGAGWKVGGRPCWTRQASWWSIPNVEEIVEALEECHDLTEDKKRALSAQAVQHAAQYDAQTVFDDHLLPALQEIEERIGNLVGERIVAKARQKHDEKALWKPSRKAA